MLAAKLGVTTSSTLRDGTMVESHRPRDGLSLLVSPSRPKQPPTCPFAATWSAGRRQRHSHTVAPARDPRRQLSRLRIVDEDRLVAALARNLGHGVSASQRAHDRRAPVRRSGSIHPGNADGHLSGDDGPGDPVAYARLLAYRLGFPGQSKPEMASGLLDNRWKFAKRKILSGEHYDTRPEAIHIWSGPVLLWNVEEAERARRLRRHDESPGGAATCGLTNARTCAIPPGGGL